MSEYTRVRLGVCIYVCVYMRAYVCVCVCMHADARSEWLGVYVCARVYSFASACVFA